MDDLYKQYFQVVFKYLFCLTHEVDLSEELAQETFYQALKTYDNFRGDCKISTWLCQIAKYLWLKEFEKRKRYTSDAIEKNLDNFFAKEDVEYEVLAGESKIELYKMLQSLDETTREVMYLRLTGDLSFREIGDILKKNETWARVTFYRGKQKLMMEVHK